MKKLTLSAIALLLAGIFLQGWSQTDAPAEPQDSLTVKYMLSADISVTAGNVTSFNSLNKGQLELEKRVIGFKLLASYRYGKVDSVINGNELVTAAYINLFPKNRVYGFINGGFEFSFLRGVQYRGYGGLGAGFRVVKTENHEFEPYINFLYEYTKFVEPVIINGDSIYERHTARGVLGWAGMHKFAKGKLLLLHNFKYQQSLTLKEDLRLDANISLSVPVFKFLSVKTGFGYTFENLVITGRKKSDFLFTFGVLLSNF